MNSFEEHDSPTEEDFAPTPPKPLGPLSHWPSIGTIWPGVFCFFCFWLLSFLYWTRPWTKSLVASRDKVFVDGDYFCLFSSLFIHSDLLHLFSNAPLFLIFSWLLYGFFGTWIFPVLSFVLGIGANLVTLYFYPAHTSLVGASGMIYGMVAFWLVLYVKHDTDHSVTIRIVRTIAFSLVVMFPTSFQSNVSYLAHASGFFLGILAGLFFGAYVRPAREDTSDVSSDHWG